MKKTSHFAEVIESCLDHYTAQNWQWNQFPSFGSLVQVDDKSKNIVGIVTHIKTGSSDPMRTPFAYQKTEDELMAEQPQIFEFLKTTFTVQIVGYLDKALDSKIYYVLPPTPCKIHAFVAPADEQLRKDFFSKTDYLHLLFAFGVNIPSLDELLLAIIKQQATTHLFSSADVDNLCSTFSLLTGNDYRRLKLFLKRVQTLL